MRSPARGCRRRTPPGCPSFAEIPSLDGVLVCDPAPLAADSHDLGNIVRHRPVAVLRPGGAPEDVARMVRFCRPRGIKVAVPGHGHTTFGQSLSPGLVIESHG